MEVNPSILETVSILPFLQGQIIEKNKRKRKNKNLRLVNKINKMISRKELLIF